jgi:hypothetical protein
MAQRPEQSRPGAQSTKRLYNRGKGGAHEVEVVAVVHDLAGLVQQEPGGAGIEKFDALDLQAHRPFDEGHLSLDRDRPRRQEHVVTALDQPLLGLDVGVDALPFLGGVLEVHILGVEGPPLLLRRRRGAVGLGEQGPQADFIHGGVRAAGGEHDAREAATATAGEEAGAEDGSCARASCRSTPICSEACVPRRIHRIKQPLLQIQQQPKLPEALKAGDRTRTGDVQLGKLLD